MGHLATNENPGGGTPGLEAHTKNLHLEITASSENTQRKSGIDPARLRHLARRLHALGERPLYELMRELVAGADPLPGSKLIAASILQSSRLSVASLSRRS